MRLRALDGQTKALFVVPRELKSILIQFLRMEWNFIDTIFHHQNRSITLLNSI